MSHLLSLEGQPRGWWVGNFLHHVNFGCRIGWRIWKSNSLVNLPTHHWVIALLVKIFRLNLNFLNFFCIECSIPHNFAKILGPPLPTFLIGKEVKELWKKSGKIIFRSPSHFQAKMAHDVKIFHPTTPLGTAHSAGTNKCSEGYFEGIILQLACGWITASQSHTFTRVAVIALFNNAIATHPERYILPTWGLDQQGTWYLSSCLLPLPWVSLKVRWFNIGTMMTKLTTNKWFKDYREKRRWWSLCGLPEGKYTI